MNCHALIGSARLPELGPAVGVLNLVTEMALIVKSHSKTEAEAILQAHLQKNLPRLDNIAQQVALSESTLKRYFKVTFGKSVYEYYLEKKMDFAKTLLLGKPITVNEAAEILGYEKVSNFIDIFKKHHGYSPGSMKKRMFANVPVPVQ